MSNRIAAGAGLGLLLLATTGAYAQANSGWVVLDGSITGAEMQPPDGVVPEGLVPDGANPPREVSYLIKHGYGEESGSNLFHSFERLSVDTGETAHFTASDRTTNIIARVPGTDDFRGPSEIYGRLESPDANLFLLNPFGVHFGEAASVDVNGSFHVSTADKLNFKSGAAFLTRETTYPELPLSSAAPASFGFLVDQPTQITFKTNQLCSTGCVPAGETFSVVGGNLLIDGNNSGGTDTISVPGGTIQLASVAKASVDEPVNVPLDVGALDFGDYDSEAFGDVTIQNRASLRVPSDGSNAGTGRIVIRGGNFVLAGGILDAEAKPGSIDSVHATAIDVAVTDSIHLELFGRNALAAVSSISSDGKSGNIRFSSEDFRMDSRARILNTARDGSAGPDTYIDANKIEIVGIGSETTVQTRIWSEPKDGGGSAAGDIYLSGRAPGTQDRAESILISDFAQVLATSADDTASGNIEMAATSIVIETNGEVKATGTGTSGVVRIDAGDAAVANSGLTVSDSGLILSLAEGGNSGADLVFTGEELSVTNGGEISTQTTASATGNGGDIHITVPEVDVSESGVIASINEGEGTGGSINITEGTSLSVKNEGQIIARTGPSAAAAATAPVAGPAPAPPASPAPRTGGDIIIRTGQLTVEGREGASSTTQISTLTRVAGVNGSDEGQGGDLDIQAHQIDLINGGQLRASTLGSAPAGNLLAVAQRSDGLPSKISIRGVVDRIVEAGPPVETASTPAGIFAQSGESADSTATGSGGTSTVEADIIEVSDGGEISSNSFGSGLTRTLSVTASERITVSGTSGRSARIVAQRDGVNVGEEGMPSGSLEITVGDGLLEIIDGGEASTTTVGTAESGDLIVNAKEIVVRGQNAQTPSGIFAQSTGQNLSGGTAGDIHLSGGDLKVADGGEVAVRTTGGGGAGSIIARTSTIDVRNGATISGESTLPSPDAGEAGSIDLEATQSIVVSNAAITTATAGGTGGSIRLAAPTITLSDMALVSASTTSTTRVPPAPPLPADGIGAGDAGDILFENTGTLEIESNSLVTAGTTNVGNGGRITIQNVDDVSITGGSEVTTKSTSTDNGGTAGTIAISANDTFELKDGSKVTSTTEDANGGEISIQAGELVYLLDSIVKSDINVNSDQPDPGAGDIFIPFAPGTPNAAAQPKFVVINESTVSANASGTGADGGDITISGREVLISADSVIEATASDPTGVSGNIQITAPDSDVVSQVTPLANSFIDASDRLLPPCIARTERTGSFIVQNRAATQPSPDSPLSAGLGTAGGAGEPSPSDSVECSVFEEKT
jgi:filamentous hemagglutinin family protein